MTKIIGICLIKNEEYYINNVIKNILDFCDEIIILDNKSTDNTVNIIEELQQKYSKIKIFSVLSSMKTNSYVNKYFKTDSWLFGVDGDEIYNRDGLKRLRKEILEGKYDKFYRIKGTSLHVYKLTDKEATGYVAPPSRRCSKLYNFNKLLTKFPENCERLHGNVRWSTFERYGFDKFEPSYFTMLHLCFISRSSKKTKHKIYKEKNNNLFLTNSPDNNINRKFEYRGNKIATISTKGFLDI